MAEAISLRKTYKISCAFSWQQERAGAVRASSMKQPLQTVAVVA
jgi:hypothetical protein